MAWSFSINTENNLYIESCGMMHKFLNNGRHKYGTCDRRQSLHIACDEVRNARFVPSSVPVPVGTITKMVGHFQNVS